MAAALLMALFAAGAPVIYLYQLDSITGYYYYHQDVWLLAIWMVATLLLMRLTPVGGRQPTLGRAAMVGLAALAGAVAYAGTWVIMQRYAQSGDEYLADFAASYLQHGWVGRPVPAELAPYAEALMPQWSSGFLNHGYWVTNYLPASAAIRAGFGLIGDRWLASPAMLAIGLIAIWYAARCFWPERREAAVVALLLAASSAQLLLGGMSPNAMGTHWGVNALWLACFGRNTRWTHATAMLLSIVAIGLHQFQFHVIFISGFLVWLAVSRRYGLVLAYALAVVVGVLWWKVGYGWTLAQLIGSPREAVPFNQSATSLAQAWLERTRTLQPHSGWLRFVVWNNVLLVPLCVAGAYWWRDRDGRPGIALACLISCAIGAASVVWQGFGFGTRYLHPVLPCFLLLATSGWMRWNDARSGKLNAPLLWGSAVAGWALTVPLAGALSYALQRPYSAAYRAIKAADADVVVVDPQESFMSDVIRLDDPVTRPLVMHFDFLDAAALRRLCLSRRVMLFDASHARALRFPHYPNYTPQAQYAPRRALMKALGCATPVPLPDR